MKDKIICILSIMILIVGGILVYQYIFEEKVDENESSNVSDNMTEDNDITNIDGEVIVQFNKEFYDLKRTAKEYVSFRNLDGVKKFNYDLDADGVVDKINFYEENNTYVVELNGKKVIESEYSTDFYIADLNEDDNLLEVILYDDGPSGDPGYVIYSKKGNSLEKNFEGLGDILKFDKEGLVVFGDSFTRDFNPSIYFDYVNFENGIATKKIVDLESIKDIDISCIGWYFSEDYNNVDRFYKEIGLDPNRVSEANIEPLDKKMTFRILRVEFIEGSYVPYVKLSDGRVGYVFFLQFAG